MRRLEHGLGRVRTKDRFAPRTIDLDLLLFDDLVADFGDWSIPDESLAQPHALVPLAEIAPSWVPPGRTQTLGELAATADRSNVENLGMITEDPTSAPLGQEQ